MHIYIYIYIYIYTCIYINIYVCIYIVQLFKSEYLNFLGKELYVTDNTEQQ